MKKFTEQSPIRSGSQELTLETIKNCVHDFLAESSKYEVRCLDLEDELTKTVEGWIKNHESQLVIDCKTSLPKTSPLMRNLEDALRSKVPLERIPDRGSQSEFHRTKIVGHWATEIFDSLLIPHFAPLPQ